MVSEVTWVDNRETCSGSNDTEEKKMLRVREYQRQLDFT
jgi:hypothetical protein